MDQTGVTSNIKKLIEKDILKESWVSNVIDELSEEEFNYVGMIFDSLSEEDGKLKFTLIDKYGVDYQLILYYIYQLDLIIFDLTTRVKFLVEVDKFVNLEKLRLGKDNIDYVCPFFKNSHINRLEIDDGWFVGFPEEITHLKSLESLLIHAKSYTLLEKEIKKFSYLSLKELILVRVEIDEQCNNFDLLSKLETLVIYSGWLTKIPDSILNMKNLKYLDLHFNELKNIPKSISNLVNLKELIIYDNYIKSIPTSLVRIKTLEKIVIDNIDEIPENLKHIVTIENFE